MSVTPDEVLALARELYNGGNASEARVRSSISRAYYAAYHSAVACAGVELPSLEAHRALIDRYDSLGKIALAGRLRSMRAARVTADYHLSRPVAGKQASISLSQAVEIINELQPPPTAQGSTEQIVSQLGIKLPGPVSNYFILQYNNTTSGEYLLFFISAPISQV